MQDVANKVGVSKVTVFKALRGNKDISKRMKERIKQAAAKIVYVYSEGVRQQTMTVLTA